MLRGLTFIEFTTSELECYDCTRERKKKLFAVWRAIRDLLLINNTDFIFFNWSHKTLIILLLKQFHIKHKTKKIISKKARILQSKVMNEFFSPASL